MAETGELAIYRRLYDEKFQELAELLADLPDDALLWKPFESSPWHGPSGTLGWLVAHGVSSTVYLLRRAEYCLGRIEYGDVEGDEGRDEFGPANHQVAYLSQRVRRAQEFVHAFLDSLDPADLDGSRPHPKRPVEIVARYDVQHALEHLSQHIGHAQMTRQLWALAAA
jgi:hypothetical protein